MIQFNPTCQVLIEETKEACGYRYNFTTTVNQSRWTMKKAYNCILEKVVTLAERCDARNLIACVEITPKNKWPHVHGSVWFDYSGDNHRKFTSDLKRIGNTRLCLNNEVIDAKKDVPIKFENYQSYLTKEYDHTLEITKNQLKVGALYRRETLPDDELWKRITDTDIVPGTMRQMRLF